MKNLCSKCGKPGEFKLRSRSRQCKKCERAYQQGYALRTRDKRLARRRSKREQARKDREKLQCSTVKTCSKCGEPGEFRVGSRQCLACRKTVWRVQNEKAKEYQKSYRKAKAPGLKEDRKLLRQARLAEKESKYEFFDSWSSDSAYALGLIFTDGCIQLNKGRGNSRFWYISIGLTDREVIEWLHFAWNSPRKIYEINKGPNTKLQYQTGVSSVHMGERLIQLGIIPKKSKIPCRLPEVPAEFRIPFIRGLIDGDGSIHLIKSRKSPGGVILRVSFVDAWNEVVQDLANILRDIGVTPRVTLKTATRVAVLRVQGEQAEKLCLLLYSDSSFCMLRKRAVWESYFRIRQKYGGLVKDHFKPKRIKPEYSWASELGTASDRDLAKKIGLSFSRIGQVRNSLGIAPYVPSPKNPPIALGIV
jgi:LAGLIDADG-like domain